MKPINAIRKLKLELTSEQLTEIDEARWKCAACGRTIRYNEGCSLFYHPRYTAQHDNGEVERGCLEVMAVCFRHAKQIQKLWTDFAKKTQRK